MCIRDRPTGAVNFKTPVAIAGLVIPLRLLLRFLVFFKNDALPQGMFCLLHDCVHLAGAKFRTSAVLASFVTIVRNGDANCCDHDAGNGDCALDSYTFFQ